MRHVFVSYRHADSEFPRLLQDKLHEADFRTWRDLALNVGDDWRADIDGAIRDSFATIVILSHASRAVLPVFISHTREDAGFMEILARTIAGNEFQVYNDRDRGEPAAPYQEADTAIRESLAVITVFSPHSMQSANVSYEWAFPLGSGVPVLPILFRAGFTRDVDNVGSFARSGLRKLGAAAGPALREAAAHAEPEALGFAISLLADIKDENDFPFFIEATRHQDPEVRRRAIYALRDKRARQAVPVLIERLRDAVRGVRKAAFDVLGDIGDPAAVQPLIECLQDEELVEDAASALKAIGTSEARIAVGTWKNHTA